jgi:hypothetical protein
MAILFNGSLNELKDRLLALDLDGDWEAQPNQVWKLRCRDRAGMLWSKTKGTVWFDGPQAAKVALAAKVEVVLADGAAPARAPADSIIFVVHGRDYEARDQLELVLRRLGLEPFVLRITSMKPQGFCGSRGMRTEVGRIKVAKKSPATGGGVRALFLPLASSGL